MTGAKYEQTLRGHFVDLTHEGHRHWMRDNNPDRWNDATWRAFNARMALDPGFNDRVRRTHKARCQWLEDQVETALHSRRASAEVRSQLRADLQREAHQKHPTPHPTEDGWTAPESMDTLSALSGSMTPRRTRSPRAKRTTTAPGASAGLDAVREITARRKAAEEAQEAATAARRTAWLTE